MSKRTSKKPTPSPHTASSPEPVQRQEGTGGGEDAEKTAVPKKRPTIFSELLPQPEDIGGLFQLYRAADGVPIRVEFGPMLTQRSASLYKKLDVRENSLAIALLLAGIFDDEAPPVLPEPKILLPFGSNLHEVHAAAVVIKSKFELLRTVCSKITQAIGADIKLVADSQADAKDRKEARKRAENTFGNALDGLHLKNRRKAHKSAAMVRVAFEDGEPRDMHLAWVALEMARELVFSNVQFQEESTLPTKGQIQAAIEKRYPATCSFSKALWSKAWSEAGLDRLPKDKAWTASEREKFSRRKARLDGRQISSRK